MRQNFIDPKPDVHKVGQRAMLYDMASQATSPTGTLNLENLFSRPDKDVWKIKFYLSKVYMEI
jgi:hypothetical protein